MIIYCVSLVNYIIQTKNLKGMLNYKRLNITFQIQFNSERSDSLMTFPFLSIVLFSPIWRSIYRCLHSLFYGVLPISLHILLSIPSILSKVFSLFSTIRFVCSTIRIFFSQLTKGLSEISVQFVNNLVFGILLHLKIKKIILLLKKLQFFFKLKKKFIRKKD